MLKQQPCMQCSCKRTNSYINSALRVTASGHGAKIPKQTVASLLGVSRSPTHLKTKMAAASQAPGSQSDKKTAVLFVCLGNICRSPTAEAMFRTVVERAGVADKFDIDSCGTGGGSSNWYQPGGFSYHEGDDADPRMSAAAIKRGVKLTSKSRPLTPSDLTRFDYIIGMDPSNIRAILKAASYWAENDKYLPNLEQVRSKTSLMTRYCSRFKAADEVPDPYYGGPAGFERVLDLLDDAATGLLTHIEEQQQAAVVAGGQQ